MSICRLRLAAAELNSAYADLRDTSVEQIFIVVTLGEHKN